MTCTPQWSPVMKTGNTPPREGRPQKERMPQWSPVMKTGNTGVLTRFAGAATGASMEPGHEDREYVSTGRLPRQVISQPQWSPVMKTGNTSSCGTSWPPGRRLNGARS